MLLLLVLLLIFGIILAKTEFGRNVYLVGGNPVAARLAGINVNKIKIILFMISGGIAALGGLILAARMNSGQPGAAANVDTDAITAVVLGGVQIIFTVRCLLIITFCTFARHFALTVCLVFGILIQSQIGRASCRERV